MLDVFVGLFFGYVIGKYLEKREKIEGVDIFTCDKYRCCDLCSKYNLKKDKPCTLLVKGGKYKLEEKFPGE